MAQGRTLAEGPFSEIRRDPRVLEAYLGTTWCGATQARRAWRSPGARRF